MNAQHLSTPQPSHQHPKWHSATWSAVASEAPHRLERSSPSEKITFFAVPLPKAVSSLRSATAFQVPSRIVTRLTILLAAALLSACATRREYRAPTARPISVPPERPGLGTSWGETRPSPVEPVAFGRASATRPSSKGLLYYNDREGIDAMLDYLGRDPRKVSGLRPAGDVSFALRGSDGQWLDSYELKGKRFTIGERGSRYEIVLKNDSPKPVEVLVSVDGLDTLDGEPARFDKRGYILDANEELAVEGFRQNDSEVAAFRFSNMGGTHAQRRHGTTENCGVVGIAIFREGRAQPPTKDQPRRHPKPLTIPAKPQPAA